LKLAKISLYLPVNLRPFNCPFMTALFTSISLHPSSFVFFMMLKIQDQTIHLPASRLKTT